MAQIVITRTLGSLVYVYVFATEQDIHFQPYYNC